MPWDQGLSTNKSAIIECSAQAVYCLQLKGAGRPSRVSYFQPPGLCSCLLTWQILGDSPCFLSSLKYMSGKSLHPHRPCCVWKR